ncbi:LuxR C-terminal-related transcriptional regulator [Nocardia africana]
MDIILGESALLTAHDQPVFYISGAQVKALTHMRWSPRDYDSRTGFCDRNNMATRLFFNAMASGHGGGSLAGLGAVITGLVGRKDELERLGGLLLGPTRLVTLIGSGGIGKTALADQAVRRLQRLRHMPVFWVPLAQLARGSDAVAVKDAIAGSVLVSGFAGPSAWDGVVSALTVRNGAGHTSQSVLVLDNCEHVLAGVGPVIAELLGEVPELTILATSREVIGWVDEQFVKVRPLSADHALALFQQRAEMTGHPITEPAQRAVVRQICRHLHGNPLFIRLAAARTFYEPLPMILQQLSGDAHDMRMHWEHGPRVGTETRQRTISDVIGWSYEMCSEKERLLFERLSVFAPGYDLDSDAGIAVTAVGADLEAIEIICSDDTPAMNCEDRRSDASVGSYVGLQRQEIRALLDRLVEQSLVTAHITAETVRYSLLESLRLFAQKRLADRSSTETDEPARLARRHRRFYRDTIAYAQAHWCSPAEQELMDRARGAWDNIHLAIETCLDAPGEAELGLELATGLITLRAPLVVGSVSAARRWVERALHHTLTPTSRPSPLQITAMAQIAWMALWEGQREKARHMLDQAVTACVSESEIRRHWREDPHKDIGLPAIVEFVRGLELMTVDQDSRAIGVFSRARCKFHDDGDSGGAALSSLNEAIAAVTLGSQCEALEIADRHLQHITETGAGWAISWAEVVWAIALIKYRSPAAAIPFVRRGLQYQIATHDQWGVVFSLCVYAWSLAQQIVDLTTAGDTDRRRLTALANEVGVIVGGVGTLRARLGVDLDGPIPASRETESAIRIARDVIGYEAFAAVRNRGSELRPELGEVQQLVLGTLPIDAIVSRPPATAPTGPTWQTLSDAEREVAVLAAAGWSNSAIGARRGTSTKTVDAQTSSVLRKLTVDSREDIIRFIPADMVDRVKTERARRPRRSSGHSKRSTDH